MILQVSNLSKSFGKNELFSRVTFNVDKGQRFALVGPNGAGKTTLMKIIAGLEDSDEGLVVIAKNKKVGYLEQESVEMPSNPLLDEVLKGAHEILALGARMQELENEISNSNSDDKRQPLLLEYASVSATFEALDGYTVGSEARSILFGLGFTEGDLTKNCDEFSGGWQMRIALARLLMRQVDLLLLDEPTNHLDLESIKWLENYLCSYSGAVIVVSHDRVFMDEMVDHVLEIEADGFQIYKGNFSESEMQRKQRIEQLIMQAQAQNEEIARMEAFIEKFRYKATKAKQVQDRVKKLEKMRRVTVPVYAKKIHFSFPQPPRCAKEALKFENVRKAYGDNVVYDGLDFTIYRGDKIALVGPNGAGKSTLMKISAMIEGIDDGIRKYGSGVKISYFSQHQLDGLTLSNTVFQELDNAAGGWTISQVRNLLGAFLFSNDAVEKKVSMLSGGEKCRLALAKMLLCPTSLLCLDEPSNYLDISSVEVLASALSEYEGTMLLISHDRYLIKKVANKIVEINGGKLTIYDGDYDFYLEKTGQLEDLSAAALEPEPESDSESKSAAKSKSFLSSKPGMASSLTKTNTGYKTKQQRREQAQLKDKRNALIRDDNKLLAKIDASMDSCRIRKDELEKIMGDESLYEDKQKSMEIMFEYKELETKLARLEEDWLETKIRIEEKLELFDQENGIV